MRLCACSGNTESGSKTGHSRSCCAKMATVPSWEQSGTVEKLLLVCTFQYSERPIMSMEGTSEGMTEHCGASSFSATTICAQTGGTQ